MKLEPRNLADLSQATCSFAIGTPSVGCGRCLVVAFHGEAGNTHAHIGTFAFMDAMIAAGVAAWQPMGVVLDLRGLRYAWGDEMARTLAGAGIHEDPPAVVVSDLNREGLTSLVKEELGGRPEKWLYESLDDALAVVDQRWTNA
jgi:hypothetical protein